MVGLVLFFVTTLVIRMNLTVLWNNGDYSKAIKFFQTLFIPVTSVLAL